MTARRDISVKLGERSYRIHVGPGLLADAGRLCQAVMPQPRAVIVTDETVAPLHLEALNAALADAGIEAGDIVLPAGEQTKSFAHLERLLDELLDTRPERGLSVIALGGGVIGDLAGFAASILLRGVNFIQVPTTLLAQVDSSVGGKTGINTRHGKNLVGSFYQPRLVLADVDLLASLPARQLRAGYAEIVKYGLINRPDFFAWLETNGPALLSGDAELLTEAVAISCQAKADIVEADEREATGQRALLNLGHTFAHALELETGYGDTLLHGEAVACGICLAFDLSVNRGLCPAEDAARVREHFRTVGLPVDLGFLPAAARDPERLIAHMAQDKKVEGGRVKYVLVNGIGQAFAGTEVDRETVAAVLDGPRAA